MSLADLDLGDLQAKLRLAYKTDNPVLDRFRDHARKLRGQIKPLKPFSVNAVSFVSSDGGDNRLTFNPLGVELVRVVDSLGNQRALDAVGSSTSSSELEKRIQPGADLVSPLQRLCADLRLSVNDLSYLLKNMGRAEQATGALRCYRDIVEWAVLYDLAADPNLRWGGDTILVRDGLLRTKMFTPAVFPKIQKLFQAGIEAHAKCKVRVSLVGVAKGSAVLSKLAVALELESVFHREYPCYVPVPPELEAECYNYERTWLATYDPGVKDEDQRYQNMGRMFLVKFGDRSLDPVWPVDIADWQKDDAPRILGQLMADAQQGFPIPDYPMCIQSAHDYAKLTGFEMQVIEDYLVRELCSSLNDGQSERILRMRHLNRSLAALRYKEG